MKKGIFVVYYDMNESSGVVKKIKNQIQSFNNNGFNMTSYLMDKNYVPGYKLLYRLPFTNLCPVWKCTKEFDGIDFVYIRRPIFMNVHFLRFLNKLKERDITIILEIPSYPYDKEITKNVRNYPVYVKEIIARKFIHKYVDRITILTDIKELYGIKTLKIKNGFDFSRIQLKNYRNSNVINLALVAQFDLWHGYERVIESLYQYYKDGGKKEVHLHFVGEGPVLNDYKQMILDFGLKDKSTFYGMQNEEFIRDIYDICDIGICSFGLYKKDAFYSCELKSREYLAAGLPIVTGCEMDIMEIEQLDDYILMFPNDDSKVDFEKIVLFYEKLYGNKSIDEKRRQGQIIRDVAMDYLSMDKSMSNVYEFLKSGD